jgi:hypothetical protein
MIANKKANKKPAKKKRPPRPGTTPVKDRIIGVPLGREAQMLAQFLRGCGADPGLVPDPRNSAANSDWTVGRGGYVKRVPMWFLDWAAAILEQIPQRSGKPGREKQDAVKSVELWALAMPVADAARRVATLEARRRGGDVPQVEDAIEKRAADLARAVYRRRRTDMP